MRSHKNNNSSSSKKIIFPKINNLSIAIKNPHSKKSGIVKNSPQRQYSTRIQNQRLWKKLKEIESRKNLFDLKMKIQSEQHQQLQQAQKIYRSFIRNQKRKNIQQQNDHIVERIMSKKYSKPHCLFDNCLNPRTCSMSLDRPLRKKKKREKAKTEKIFEPNSFSHVSVGQSDTRQVNNQGKLFQNISSPSPSPLKKKHKRRRLLIKYLK